MVGTSLVLSLLPKGLAAFDVKGALVGPAVGPARRVGVAAARGAVMVATCGAVMVTDGGAVLAAAG